MKPTRRNRLAGVNAWWGGGAVGRQFGWQLGDPIGSYDDGWGPRSPNRLVRRRVAGEWDDPVFEAVELRADIEQRAREQIEWNGTPEARRRHFAVSQSAEARRFHGIESPIHKFPSGSDAALRGLWVVIRVDERLRRRYWMNRPDWWTQYMADAAVFGSEDLAWWIGECYQDGSIDVVRA